MATTTATTTARTFQASTSNSAGSTATGSSVDLRTALGCLVTAKVTNGATGPTVPCSVRVDVSTDNSAWKTFALATAQVGNSIVTEFAFDLPASVMYARTVFTGNTAQAVTVEAFGHELTSLSTS